MDLTKQMESVIRAFRSSGLRWTSRRQMVIETLFRLDHHPTAEDIYARVRRKCPGMSRATVYNTMESLAALGRIHTLTAPDGTRRYDPNITPHHHLRCRICDSIADCPPEPETPAPELRARGIDGFRIESVQVEYCGVCSACDRVSPGRQSEARSGRGGKGTKRPPQKRRNRTDRIADEGNRTSKSEPRR